MKRITTSAVLAVLALVVLMPGCGGEDAFEWELTFEDEFEGPDDQLPDDEYWQFDVGGWGWGNNQLEYDSDRSYNASLDGYGHLRIRADRETFDLCCDYTSARITTKDLFEQDRGKFEARIKLPVGQGIWPAFWLLGADFPTVGWPECGEIDIMEYKGQEPTYLIGSLHGPGYSGGDAISRRVNLGIRLDMDYHVYSIEWDLNRITWKFDGTPYHVVTPQDIGTGNRWVFDHPFFIILNVAVGGNFVGDPDETTQFPQEMLIDWVRVYRGK